MYAVRTTRKSSSAGRKAIAMRKNQRMGKVDCWPWGLNWPIIFPIVLKRMRSGIVGSRNATNNKAGSAKMPGWRRSCLRISSLGWKSENGFMVLAGFALLHGEDFHDFVAEVV